MTTFTGKMTYEIQTLTRCGHGSTWDNDGIGLNDPRSLAECKADVAAFRRGECGAEFSATFQNFNAGRKFRIVEASA